ncbi:MAG: hypothetical protein WAV56_04455 [Microgenomates group bacterium]
MVYLLTVSLPLLAVFISILPLLSAIPQGVFYGFDPDAVYVGNALSYIQSHQIQYAEHPGTPAIWLIAQSFLPLRFYAKYIVHESFIDWAFLHYNFIFTYSRFFQALLFGIALFFLLTAVWRFSRSKLAVIFVWVATLVFWPVPYLGSIISPETLSVLLASLWLLVLHSFIKNRSSTTLLLLSFLAGVALANKTTNISLSLATLVLCVAHYRRQPIFPRLIRLVLSIFAIIAGFLTGLWPIRDRILHTIMTSFKFASHTAVHGNGPVALIDIPIFLTNLKTFHLQNPVVLPLLTVSLMLAGYCFFSKSKKIPFEIPLIYISTLSIFMAFFKFSLFHYQLANYLILFFFSGILIAALFRLTLFPLCLVLLWFLPVSTQRYFREVSQLSTQVKTLESFIANHPPQIATVWEWGRSRDFAYFWARGWGTGVFDRQLKTYRPDLLELNSDFLTVVLSYRDQKPVFDVCWDQLYIQQTSAPKFLGMYSDRPIIYEKIPGTSMALVTSSHCQKK